MEPTQPAASPFMEIPKLDEVVVASPVDNSSAANLVVNEESRIDQLAREFVSKPTTAKADAENGSNSSDGFDDEAAYNY